MPLAVSICLPSGHNPGFSPARGSPISPCGTRRCARGEAQQHRRGAFRGPEAEGWEWEESESELQAEQVPVGRRLVNGWMAVAGRFGGVQTLLLLVLIYVVLIGPVSVVQALARRDQLDKRALWKKESAWRQSESGGTDLERAKLLS